MNFEALNEAWNELRSVVVGRGTAKPAGVPQDLYTRVGNASERWQNFYEHASALDQEAFQLTAPEFLNEYRSLADAAKAAGLVLKKYPMMTGTETISRVLSNAAPTVASVGASAALIIGLVLAIPLALVFMVPKRHA